MAQTIMVVVGVRNYQLWDIFWIVSQNCKTLKGTGLWLKGWKEQLMELSSVDVYWVFKKCPALFPLCVSPSSGDQGKTGPLDEFDRTVEQKVFVQQAQL